VKAVPVAVDANLALALAALLGVGCSSAAGDAGDAAAETRLGANGVVEFVATSEGALAEGDNHFEVALRHVETDQPLAGAALQAETVMRSMGHQSATAPHVEEIGEGRYQVAEVVFSMPGLWELRLSASKDALYDEVGFVFEVP
jgi:hypothetical protein